MSPLGGRAGETLEVHVSGKWLDKTLAALAVLDERGNELDFNDDFYIHKDPHLAFTAPRSGDYFVQVSGSQEGGSPSSPYRLIAGAVPHMLRVAFYIDGRLWWWEFRRPLLSGATWDCHSLLILVARLNWLKELS